MWFVAIAACGSLDAGPVRNVFETLSGPEMEPAVRIDVEPAGTADAGAAAAELAGILRQVTGRLEALSAPAAGTALLAAWAATWSQLRAGLLALATTGDELAATSRAAATGYRQTESGLMVPDEH